MDATEWTIVGLAGGIITGSVWIARYIAVQIFAEGGPWPTAKEWGGQLVHSIIKTHAELTSCSRINTETLASLKQQQVDIWNPLCRLMRAEIETRDIDDDSKRELLSHVEEVEQGLEKSRGDGA